MNLAEAFAVLANTGCRLRVEAEGGIILDVSPGCPPVPPSVLQVLAAHRESLVAVLAPAKPPESAEGPPTETNPDMASAPASPYARDLSLEAQAARRAATLSARQQLEPVGILRRAREKASKLRERQQLEGQLEFPTPGLPLAMDAAGGPGTNDDIPF